MQKSNTFYGSYELNIFYLQFFLPNPEAFFKVSEVNPSCIVVAKSKNNPTRTKHVAIKYHCLRNFVQKKKNQMCYVDTIEQRLYIFTKTLDKVLFVFLHRKLYGK